MNTRAWIVLGVIATWLAGCSQSHPPLESPGQSETVPEEPDDVDPGAEEAAAEVDGPPPMVGEQPAIPLPENYDNACELSGAYDPLVPRDGEVCYEFRAHNGNGVDPYEVQRDESYNQIYYEIPWAEDTVATRIGGDYDNVQVLYRWLMFASDVGTPGTVERNVTGTTLFTNAQLLAGWSTGGCTVELPQDFGLALPGPSTGKTLMIQWHHLNLTGTEQPDATTVQVCTVPRSERAHIGGMTMLGTEDLNDMPAGAESKRSGSCLNETAEPITLVALWPYMHELGTEVALDALAPNGAARQLFDRPYQHDFNQHYLVNAALAPGEKVRTTCTYFNNTAQTVGFGQSATQEMCFVFAFSYPAGALDNGVISLFGPTNTCW